MDSGGSKRQMETSFTILLKKPNLYRTLMGPENGNDTGLLQFRGRME